MTTMMLSSVCSSVVGVSRIPGLDRSGCIRVRVGVQIVRNGEKSRG